ncbi:MAG: molybdenum cofactor guanylyltransferase MobA [Spongiibacteraceae bacterium]|jgi:molybdopterin-guanine dinucleotide biosynthesis protein A|nr:molybdenum cofactor guanylyltransferase MobA [Spongiibacteraceae bacterium]
MQQQITGVILAGGRGQRLGGVDKAMLTWHGKRFLEHIADRLRPQVSRLLLSVRSASSRNYAGYETVTDPGEGPLGGMLAALRISETPLTLFVPCDNPTPSAALAERLLAALNDHEIAYASYGGDHHWLYALVRTQVWDELEKFWQAGGRAPHRWYATRDSVAVAFDDMAPSAFRNINTRVELEALEDN